MSSTRQESNQQDLAAGLVVEDHGTEFYLVSRGEGHDLTLSLEADVAEQLARFILSRRGQLPALGGRESSTP